MTINEFAAYIAKKAEAMTARRYGVTSVEVTGSEDNPMLHMVNKDFNIDRSVPVAGPYKDFVSNGETQADTYAEALVFELEYAMFEDLTTNTDISAYMDFSKAGEMLYTKLLDVDRSRGVFLEGALGRKVDDYSIMVLYIHDGRTKTFVNEALVKAWGVRPAALFIKASENSGTYQADAAMF